MRVAIYRVLYGADYIDLSIKSILPIVDQVVVAKAERPWGTSAGVMWKNEWVKWPEKFDDTRERIMDMHEPAVEVVDDFWPSPKNQHQHIVNDLVLSVYRADEVICIEPDHIFTDAARNSAIAEWVSAPFKQATTRMIELWRTPDWRIAERHRASVMFHRIHGKPMRDTSGDGGQSGISSHWLQAEVHNLGFMMSEQTTYWKHLTAMAFSDEIHDAPPDPLWLDKWLTWKPGVRDLEISLGGQHTIPEAFPYDSTELPPSVLKRFADIQAHPR
jgi:hypothetical protein